MTSIMMVMTMTIKKEEDFINDMDAMKDAPYFGFDSEIDFMEHDLAV